MGTKKQPFKNFSILNKYITSKFLYHNTKPSIQKQWRSLLFTGKSSYKIANIIEKEEKIQVAFYNPNKPKNKIFNNKDKIDPMDKCGIHNIIVPEHGEYIGKTARSINTRIKDHFASVNNNHPEKSGFASYMIEHNLPTTSCNVKILNSNVPNNHKKF